MAHNPVNHPARPIYRAIGGLIGLYLVIFGMLGLIVSAGNAFFAQDDTLVLGQGVNLGSSVLFILIGALVVAAVGLGRNIDVRVNKLVGYLLMAIGLGALAVLRTDANFLNFSTVTCMVTMVLGIVLLTAAMYSTVGTEEEAKAWRDGRLVL